MIERVASKVEVVESVPEQLTLAAIAGDQQSIADMGNALNDDATIESSTLRLLTLRIGSLLRERWSALTPQEISTLASAAATVAKVGIAKRQVENDARTTAERVLDIAGVDNDKAEQIRKIVFGLK